MRTGEVVWRAPVECGGDNHHVWIDERGNMHLENHNLEMLQGFSAFGATKPQCLYTWERWEKYRKGITDIRLGAVAFENGFSRYKLNDVEERWRKTRGLVRQLEKRQGTIPTVEVEGPNLRLERMPETDPRVLFLGASSDSGRKVDGYRDGGEDAVWYGVESPNSGFYVVLDDDDKIIAESWVWRHGDIVMFDSIAGKLLDLDKEVRKEIFDLLKAASEMMIEADDGIAEVRLGEIMSHDIYHIIEGVGWAPDCPQSYDIIPPPFDAILKYNVGSVPSAKKQYILATREGGSLYFQGATYKDSLADAIAGILKRDRKHRPRSESPRSSHLGYYAKMSSIPVMVVVVERQERESPAGAGIVVKETHELRVGDRTIATWKPCSVGKFTDIYANDWETEDCDEHQGPGEFVTIFLEEAIPGYSSDLDPEEPDYSLPHPTDTGIYSVWVDDRELVGSYDEEGDAEDAAEFVRDVLRLSGVKKNTAYERVGFYQLVDWIDPETEYWYPEDIANWERIG
jgi:hypothetical protein